MDASIIAVARTCLEGAEHDTMGFPQIVGTLMQVGFDGYAIDFRRGSATYYLPDGDWADLPLHRVATPVAAAFDAAAVRAAIADAQRQAPGYSYRGFCERVAAAGCAGYVVSSAARRVLYVGRTAETHVEHSPD